MNAQNNSSSLTAADRSLVAISSYTAQGDIPQLQKALNEGLDNGLPINEVKTILSQLYAYCGFPRALNALNTFMSVVEERKAQGKNDVEGKEASPISRDIDMFEQGQKVRTELIGRVYTGKLVDFCPEIDSYLRAHLFGDIFAHDNATYKQRELATVSALAGMGMAAQLRSHSAICLNLGWTEAQLAEAVAIATPDRSTGNTRTLVAYFSAQGHTQAVAERIVELTGADVYRIEAADP